MARLFPERPPAGPVSERLVFEALRDRLPAPWHVWHAVAYSAARGGAEGEADFVAAHPARGLLVIEVKGGRLACRGGQWFQDGLRLRESPAHQATRNAHALIRVLAGAFGAPPAFPVAHAVWFTGVDRPAGEPLDLAGLTLYAGDLADPEPALLRVLGGVGRPPAPVPLEAVAGVLSPTLEFRPAWVRRRALQDARIARLTEEQGRALDAFAAFPRLRVRGCAGSGKTLLALRQAAIWACGGRRVLLLCFNLLLAERLRALVADLPRVRAVAVNELLCELLGRRDDGDPEFWHRLQRDALPAARGLAARRAYDAVIVDEGQDFSPPLWAAVQALVPEGARFLVFYDPAQNIFQRDLSALPEFPWPDACLTVNCRNTRGVFETLAPYAPGDARPNPRAPEGEATEIYRAENRAALRARLGALLARLGAEGVPPEDILLIGAHARPRMGLEGVLAAYPGVRYYTYRKFKGLEAPVLIVLDVCDGNPLWDRAARYTAFSRAIHRLFVLELAR